MSKVYLISDTHFNHAKIATYCDRPENFTETLIRNWVATVKHDDTVIHLGDVFIGKTSGWFAIYPLLTGRKILVWNEVKAPSGFVYSIQPILPGTRKLKSK